MSKSKVRVYSEKKAKRASNHQQILIQKLKRSLNNRTDSEKAWCVEIEKIENAWVSVVCDTCKKPKMVNFENWQVGKFEKICKACKLISEKAEMKTIKDLVSPILPKGYGIYIELGGWNQGTITIQRDKP